jgi:hypothetical protein
MDINKFLQPESMLTPGAAGATTMAIANTLWVQFGWAPRWTGLGVSALFGFLVIAATQAPKWRRGIYFLLNTLIIFTVALGANAGGNLATGDGAAAGSGGGKPEAAAWSLVRPAWAQPAENEGAAQSVDPARLRQLLGAHLSTAQLNAVIRAVESEQAEATTQGDQAPPADSATATAQAPAEELRPAAAPSSAAPRRRFFTAW